MKKHLSALLAALLLLGALGGLADGEPRKEAVTVPDYWEELDEYQHAVTATVWEYPIVDGQRASGRPAGDAEYLEAHAFRDAVCVLCGHACPTPGEILDTAWGFGLLRGVPASGALRAVLAALPDDAAPAFPDVDAAAADRLLEALRPDADPEALAQALADFPTDRVDGEDCVLVTLSATDADGRPAADRYAFRAADLALAQVS